MTVRMAYVVGLAAAVAACSPKVKVSVEFTCEGGEKVRAEFRNDSAFVSLPGQQVALAQAVSASGARYTDGDIQVWNKGKEITVSKGDSVIFQCKEE